MKNIFVTGIGTDVGKTVASAIIVQAFHLDYWKPVQAGSPGLTDSDQVRNLVSRTDYTIHPEAFRLSQPLSPHSAAKKDGQRLCLDNILLPATIRPMVIEGAGGVMVPLNNDEFMADLIQKLSVEVVIVSRNYLGSINHSLLTFEALERRNISVIGWIFNGEKNADTEEIIAGKSGKPVLLRIAPEEKINKEIILKYANEIIQNEKFKR